MRKRSECLDRFVDCDGSHNKDKLRQAERISECPYCGASMSVQIKIISGCGRYATTYECGSQFVVNYLHSWFIAVKSVSDTCEVRSKLLCSSDDVI